MNGKVANSSARVFILLNSIQHSSAPRPTQQAPLRINFLIVGGGLTGLACAFALRRVGHGVTVLEKDPNIDGDGVCLFPLFPSLTDSLTSPDTWRHSFTPKWLQNTV